MKKFRGFFLFLLLIGMNLFPQTAIAIEDQEVKEQWIVGFKEDIDLSVFNGTSYKLNHSYEVIDAVAVSIDSEHLEQVSDHSKIKWMEESQEVRVSQQQVTNWGYVKTESNYSSAIGVKGKGVKIALIDTGINMDHPDLKIAGGISFVDDSPTYDDKNGHGTHVAGIINAQDNEIGIVGIAPKASIYGVKVLDEEGVGRESDVIAGIEWAIKNDMDIINLSLTSENPNESEPLKEIIDEAESQGIIIVAASGNDRTGDGQITSDVLYPSRDPDVISVGAVDKDLSIADYSYQGESLDFVGPGSGIYSTYIEESGTPYAYLSGTSMAAPFVSGTIALYEQLFPNLSFDAMKEILIRNSVDLGPDGKDRAYGYGFIQTPASYFKDVKRDEWFVKYINDLTIKNWIEGYNNQTFQPQWDMTRQEVVTLLGRALGLDGTQRATIYPDVPKELYGSGYIASATERGIIEGLNDDTFRPEEPIKRGDVALIIYRAFDIPSSSENVFEDVERDAYYAESINSLAEADIIDGYPGGQFKPQDPISRAEVAALLSKTINPSIR